MTKKYDYPEENPQIVGEPIAAYTLQEGLGHHMTVKTQTYGEDDIDWEKLEFVNPHHTISDDELRRLGRECIDAPSVSAEEAMTRLRAVCL